MVHPMRTSHSTNRGMSSSTTFFSHLTFRNPAASLVSLASLFGQVGQYGLFSQVGPGCRIRGIDLFLFPHHFALRSGVVVISQQVQAPMDDKPVQFVVHGHVMTGGLVPGPVDGYVNVAQGFPFGSGIVVHSERQHVRRAIQMAVLVIQLPDIGVIDQHHGHGRTIPAFTPEYPADCGPQRLARNVRRGQDGLDLDIQVSSRVELRVFMAFIGLDDVLDEPVPDHVRLRQVHK